ncbi:MAG: hypothetical protein ACI8X5_003929 [Planctomycetota bacterium]|jgi:hypothetical protein
MGSAQQQFTGETQASVESDSWTIEPLAHPAAASLQDGVYQLRVSARDQAMNSTDLSPIEFNMARFGPQIRFETMGPFVGLEQAEWEVDPGSGSLQAIRIAGNEANGIGSIRCSVFHSVDQIGLHTAPDWKSWKGISGVSLENEIEPGVTSGLWTWSFDPSHD